MAHQEVEEGHHWEWEDLRATEEMTMGDQIEEGVGVIQRGLEEDRQGEEGERQVVALTEEEMEVGQTRGATEASR